MRLWGQHINQWSAWQRCLLLFGTLFIIWNAWYFCLEKPLLKDNAVTSAKQVQLQETLKEFGVLLQLKENFVYQKDLQFIPLRQVFQDEIMGVPGLEIISFTDNPALVIQAGATQFIQIKEMLRVSLLSVIHRAPATIVFSGKFEAFELYLKALQNANPSIYFESINFNMSRYPQAKITMHVFTLGG